MRIPDYPSVAESALDGSELFPVWKAGQQDSLTLQAIWSYAAALNPAFKASSQGWLLSPLSRAALAAIAGPVNGQAAYLAEPGREGPFVFSNANLLAHVTADAAQGIYVAPASDTTGASGAWIRKYSRIVRAAWFGAVGDGVTDDTVALTCFVNSAIANPGVRHWLDQKTYGISAILPTISVDGVIIEGAWGTYHDDPPMMTGTTIKWISSANSGAMLTVTPVTGSSGQYLTGIMLRGIGFDCNSLIAKGLRAESVRNGQFVLAGSNSTSVLFGFGVTSGTLGEGPDLQNNLIHIYGRQIEQRTGICLEFDGSSVANASFNDIYCELEHTDNEAILCTNSDNNLWHRVKIKCSGSATYSMRLQGAASDAVACRAERFLHFSANLPPKICGTDEYTVASTGHRFHNYDIENSSPAPVLGPGAWIDCEMPQTYTPTITGAAGTGLTIGTVLASYIRQNNFVDLFLSIQITAGSGYTSLNVTAPFASAGIIDATCTIVEAGVSSKDFSGYLMAGTSNLVIHSPDGSTAIPPGTYSLSLRYRVR